MFVLRTSTFAAGSTLTASSDRRVVLKIDGWRPLSGPREKAVTSRSACRIAAGPFRSGLPMVGPAGGR
jgi:hypothetical protein